MITDQKPDKIVNTTAQEEITFLITSRQSGGKTTLMDVMIGPKGGNPLHYHRRFAETFTVIEGELTVQVGKEIKTLRHGESAVAPINVRHRFYNTSGKPVRFTCELNPASEGFENVMRIGFGLEQDGQAGPNGMPRSFVHNGILMNMGDGYFVGLFSILENIFRFFGKSAKAKQIEKELLERYCTK